MTDSTSTMSWRVRTPERGIALLEVAIALTIITILVGVVMSISFESSRFFSMLDRDHIVHLEANRALQRLTEELRRSGWNTAGGIEYPRVSPDGTELEFRVLRDLDGNSEFFDGESGVLEWGAMVYTVRRNAGDDTLAVYDTAGNLVLALCRHVDRIGFASYKEDPILQLREIRIEIEVRDKADGGETVACVLDSGVVMRN